MRRVTIEETAGGWNAAGVAFPTAVDALEAVRLASALTAATSGRDDLVEVRWIPDSHFGGLLVAALGAEELA